MSGSMARIGIHCRLNNANQLVSAHKDRAEVMLRTARCCGPCKTSGTVPFSEDVLSLGSKSVSRKPELPQETTCDPDLGRPYTPNTHATVRLLMHTDHVSDAAIYPLGIGDIQHCLVLVLLIHNSPS